MEFSNAEIHRELAHLVARKYLGIEKRGNSLKIGPLIKNYFSFTFSVDISTPYGYQGVFVKIPKADSRNYESIIFPITEVDRRLASEEEASLSMLEKQWQTEDLDIRWVKLRGFIQDYNAVITDRVQADGILSKMRMWDLRRRIGIRKDAEKLKKVMKRLGEALGRFHQSHVQSKDFHVKHELVKFERYCRELKSITQSPWPARVLDTVRSMEDRKFSGIIAPTLKGIDIRNVLIDRNDRLTLLDPGKCKIKFCEADISRFLMTYRILYWGSSLLLLARQPDSNAETEFLNAYYTNNRPESQQILRCYMLKEVLKHWYTAYISLSRIPWSQTIKKWVSLIYIDPFYNRQMSQELTKLEKYK